MHFAVESNNIQCVEILIAGGAWINEADRQGRTPVYMAAAGRSSMEMLELLLDNPDCNIHLKDHQFGRTPLQVGLPHMEKCFNGNIPYSSN